MVIDCTKRLSMCRTRLHNAVLQEYPTTVEESERESWRDKGVSLFFSSISSEREKRMKQRAGESKLCYWWERDDWNFFTCTCNEQIERRRDSSLQQTLLRDALSLLSRKSSGFSSLPLNPLLKFLNHTMSRFPWTLFSISCCIFYPF